MKQFKDFGIVLAKKVLTGDKVKMAKILNREIKVLNFKIDESKYPKIKVANVYNFKLNMKMKNM